MKTDVRAYTFGECIREISSDIAYNISEKYSNIKHKIGARTCAGLGALILTASALGGTGCATMTDIVYKKEPEWNLDTMEKKRPMKPWAKVASWVAAAAAVGVLADKLNKDDDNHRSSNNGDNDDEGGDIIDGGGRRY